MATWFSKVFKSKEDAGHETEPSSATGYFDDAPEEMADPLDDIPPPRRVVQAPLIADAEEAMTPEAGKVRIKAREEDNGYGVVFLVDRPVLEGYSFVCPDRDTANAYAPLAAALFDQGGIGAVTIHDFTVTVQSDGSGRYDWEDWAKALGGVIRQHLLDEKPVLLPEVREKLPSEDEVRAGVQRVLDEEVNPGIAAHSGVITLSQVKGNTVYITMGGGCQGCAASSITLRAGVESAFRDAVPLLGAVLDETDHSAGVNPYFRELPAGMGGM